MAGSEASGSISFQSSEDQTITQAAGKGSGSARMEFSAVSGPSSSGGTCASLDSETDDRIVEAEMSSANSENQPQSFSSVSNNNGAGDDINEKDKCGKDKGSSLLDKEEASSVLLQLAQEGVYSGNDEPQKHFVVLDDGSIGQAVMEPNIASADEQSKKTATNCSTNQGSDVPIVSVGAEVPPILTLDPSNQTGPTLQGSVFTAPGARGATTSYMLVNLEERPAVLIEPVSYLQLVAQNQSQLNNVQPVGAISAQEPVSLVVSQQGENGVVQQGLILQQPNGMPLLLSNVQQAVPYPVVVQQTSDGPQQVLLQSQQPAIQEKPKQPLKLQVVGKNGEKKEVLVNPVANKVEVVPSAPEPVNEATSEKIIKCDLCHASFTRPSNFARHRLTHVVDARDNFRYKCQKCGRSFIQKCDLRRHMHIHNNTQPYKCSVCGQGYIRQSDLKVHMNFHMKLRPFKCQYCNKAFCQSGDQKRHERSVHLRQKQLVCGHCGNKYSNESTLMRHIQWAHKNLLLSTIADESPSPEAPESSGKAVAIESVTNPTKPPS